MVAADAATPHGWTTALGDRKTLLSDLGNLGDFIGGIAVVVSLVYLAFQIRRNTQSVQAGSVQGATQAISEIMELMARDAEILRIFDSGTHDFNALSKEDRLRFSSLMGAIIHRFENLVSQTENGLLPRDSWDGGANRLRGTFALPGTLEWWAKGKGVFSSQLQNWVESEVIGKPPAV